MTDEKDNAEPSGASGGSLAWIPVKERMPEHCQIVMVTGSEIRHCEMAWVYEGREPWRNHYGEVYEANSVTHWMPLPARPEASKQPANQ